MAALERAMKAGGWVLLQNVHLTIEWTSGPLEKRVDKLAEDSHQDFRQVSKDVPASKCLSDIS